MRVFKNKAFSKWAVKEGLDDQALLAYKVENKAFFVYGFAKNARSNVSTNELKALKHLAKELLSYSDEVLSEAVKQGALIEVENNG